MLYLFFPIGDSSGWDTCGKYLAIELSKETNVTIVTASTVSRKAMADELEYLSLSGIPINHIGETQFDRERCEVKGVSLRMLNDYDLDLWLGDIKSKQTIGYTFYLGSPLEAARRSAASELELIVAGSSFCEDQLKKAGLRNTKTIIQGINPQIFNPANSAKALFKDRFVIFSGGKFELRKGQDIVLKAFKHFCDRHPDALLVNLWPNLWEFSLRSMEASPLISFRFDFHDYMGSMNDLYRINGIDPAKVITLPMKPFHELPYIFKNTDIGLFPNRCEGGTNLVLMEYMACGKPTIASAQTGHADIINEEVSFPIFNCRAFEAKNGNYVDSKGWIEPDIDEIIHYLEMSYVNSEKCLKKGKAAGQFLSALTWTKAAKEFFDTAMEISQ